MEKTDYNCIGLVSSLLGISLLSAEAQFWSCFTNNQPLTGVMSSGVFADSLHFSNLIHVLYKTALLSETSSNPGRIWVCSSSAHSSQSECVLQFVKKMIAKPWL